MSTGLNEVRTRDFWDARHPTKILRAARPLHEVETLTLFYTEHTDRSFNPVVYL